MARYRWAPNGAAYGPPRGLAATVLKVRETCKRDGSDYQFKPPNEGWGRQYHSVLRIVLVVARGLRRAKVGDLSKLSTGNKGPTKLGHVYLIRKVKKAPEQTPGEKAVEYAKTELGTIYRFGAANGPEDAGPDSFDCSGLTQWAWQQAAGITLPHSAELQRNSSLVSLFFDAERTAVGDLVFMNFPNSRGIYPPHASHVGLLYRKATPGIAALMIDTRNPVNEPVDVRPIELGNVVGYGRVRVT